MCPEKAQAETSVGVADSRTGPALDGCQQMQLQRWNPDGSAAAAARAVVVAVQAVVLAGAAWVDSHTGTEADADAAMKAAAVEQRWLVFLLGAAAAVVPAAAAVAAAVPSGVDSVHSVAECTRAGQHRTQRADLQAELSAGS